MKTFIIQNADKIVRAADYKHLAANKLLVTSIFRTIQGEGPYAGCPAIFLRLSGCNYGDKAEGGACQFCDTSFQFDKGRVMTFDEIHAEIKALPGYNASHVLVVTGGEPTLQYNLINFMEKSWDMFFQIQLETNGTQSSFFSRLTRAHTQEFRPAIVVSPKAQYSVGKYGRLSDTVAAWATDLKFVVEDDPSSPHYKLPSWVTYDYVSHCTVWVSPMARYKKAYEGEVASIWDRDLIDEEATARNYSYAAKFALEHNYRLSLQQHLFVGIA